MLLGINKQISPGNTAIKSRLSSFDTVTRAAMGTEWFWSVDKVLWTKQKSRTIEPITDTTRQAQIHTHTHARIYGLRDCISGSIQTFSPTWNQEKKTPKLLFENHAQNRPPIHAYHAHAHTGRNVNKTNRQGKGQVRKPVDWLPASLLQLLFVDQFGGEAANGVHGLDDGLCVDLVAGRDQALQAQRAGQDPLLRQEHTGQFKHFYLRLSAGNYPLHKTAIQLRVPNCQCDWISVRKRTHLKISNNHNTFIATIL